MNNLDAVELIRERIRSHIEREGFVLRPYNLNRECCAWVDAEDILGFRPDPNDLECSCQLISTYKREEADPDEEGWFDDINGRVGYALTMLEDYIRRINRYKAIRGID